MIANAKLENKLLKKQKCFLASRPGGESLASAGLRAQGS